MGGTPFNSLTKRQREVFLLHARTGWNQKDMAVHLDVSHKTIGAHLRIAANKMDMQPKHWVRWCVRFGVLKPDEIEVLTRC